MSSFSKKNKLIKFFSVLLCLELIFYSSLVPFSWYSYSFASESCDPTDEDYQECLAEQEEEARENAQEAAEEERERLEDQLEEKQDFDEELYEDYFEKFEDLPGWKPIPTQEFLDQYYGITPTPTIQPTTSPAINESSTVGENQQLDDEQGEGSVSETRENTNDSIFIENYNHDTTLEQNIYTEANTGENVISGDLPPADDPNSDQPSASKPGPALSCPSSTSTEEDEFKAGNNEEMAVSQDEDDQKVDASGENQDVGDDSETQVETTNNDQTRVTNKNCVEVKTDNTAIANTGGNDQLDNEGAAQMETGPGEAQGRTEVYGNINQTEVQATSSAEAKNENTGEDSTNFSRDEQSETLIVENDNQIAAQNNLSVSAESGENQLIDNEDEATLTTGPLDIMAALLNILNLNITGEDFEFLLVNIFGQFTGEVDLDDIAEEYLNMSEEELKAIAVNYRTGENSENEAQASNQELLEVSNNNQAQVQNNLNVSGTSGQNELSENEDPVNLLTGRIKIVAAILNLINTNLTGTDWLFAMINIFGTLEGDIILPDPDQFLLAAGGVEASNSEEGEGSINLAEASNTSDISVANDNQATVVNNVDVRGDSGRNQAYANEDETNLETQDVNISTNVIDWLDVNIFGNRFVLLIVNVMGRWLGNVIAFPGKGTIAPPEEGILVAAASGVSTGPEVVAQNNQVGDDSTNTAVASSETTWAVDNQNVAAVENNIDVSAVSGQNKTNLNEDPVTVTTGWIDVNVDLLNIINLNVTGREWLLVMVNIFGDFFGNVIFPQNQELSDQLNDKEPEVDFQEQEESQQPIEDQNEADGQENQASAADENQDSDQEENIGGPGADQTAGSAGSTGSDDQSQSESENQNTTSSSNPSSVSSNNNNAATQAKKEKSNFQNTNLSNVEVASHFEEQGQEFKIKNGDLLPHPSSLDQENIRVLGITFKKPFTQGIIYFLILTIGLIAFYKWFSKRLDKLN